MRAPCVVVLWALVGGCAAPASSQDAPPPAPPPQSTAPAPPPVPSGIRLLVEPADAQIVLGSEPAGSVAALAKSGGILPLPPGDYAITLKRDGYVTWRGEVSLREGVEVLEVRMERAVAP